MTHPTYADTGEPVLIGDQYYRTDAYSNVVSCRAMIVHPGCFWDSEYGYMPRSFDHHRKLRESALKEWNDAVDAAIASEIR